MFESEELNNLSESEIQMSFASASSKLHSCMQTGADVTITQKEVYSLMKITSGKLFNSVSKRLGIDDFPEVLDGERTSEPDVNYVLPAEPFEFPTPGKYVQEFVFITGKGKNHIEQLEYMREQLNELLKTKSPGYIGNFQFTGANLVLPVMMTYYKENEQTDSDSSRQTETK